MAIKVFIQGKSPFSDRELFGLVGRFLVSAEIQEQLGMAITSRDGDIWFVSEHSNGEVRGFATSRLMKTGSLHVRFVHCQDDALLVCKAMITKAITQAKEFDCRSVFTNDRETSTLWQEFGFSAVPRARGTFCRWEYPIGDDE